MCAPGKPSEAEDDCRGGGEREEDTMSGCAAAKGEREKGERETITPLYTRTPAPPSSKNQNTQDKTKKRPTHMIKIKNKKKK